ncbi:hypothetical protein ABPG77_006487 [Micractinium sp. CCAP 211/92]
MAGPARSCLKLQDASSDSIFFASVTRHGAGPEAASVDLAVTDASGAWTATGITGADLKGQAPHKLSHFLAALSDLEPRGLPYKTEFAERDGGLLVKVSWQASPNDPRVLVSATLPPAPSAPSVIGAMLALLTDNVAALRGMSESLLAQVKEYDKQVAQKDHLVESYVKNKEAQDRDTYIKVAALLNSKKAKLRELQQQVDELQEENQRLKEGGALAAAATEPMEADDEDEARQPSTAKTAGPARLGRGRQQVVEEGDDESDSGEEDRGRSQSPPREYD